MPKLRTEQQIGSMADDDRPIRPAGEAVMNMYAGRHPVTNTYIEDEDDEEDMSAQQNLERALLGLPPLGASDDEEDLPSDADEGINELNEAGVLERAAEDSSGLSAAELAGIASIENKEKEPTECSVCLQQLEQGQLIAVLHCSHRFHHVCILRWLGRVNKCPYCRADVSAGSESAKEGDHSSSSMHA